MRKRYGTMLGLALVVMFVFSWNAKTAAAINLSDIENHWARQEITEMYCSDILTGYPGGVFKPGNDVTRLEVVAMLLRVMGLEEQAKNMENTKVDYAVPQVNWGRGYLLVGVQQGMLDKDYLVQLRPSEVASRAEVAVLLYHAMNLEDTTVPLTFVDTKDIPADYQSCVAAVVGRGIMQGMPGNVFMPNEAVNRGQMAAMLSRVLALNYGDPNIQSRRFSGVCTGIVQDDQTSWEISLNNPNNQWPPASNQPVRLTAPGCEVFVDGRSTTINKVELNHRITMVVGKDGLVTFIRASTTDDSLGQNNNSNVSVPATGTDYKGRFDSVREVAGVSWLTIATIDGAPITRQIDPTLQVNNDGASMALSSLGRGDYVSIKLSGDNKVVEVKTIKTEIIKGTVTVVRSNGFALVQDSGSEYEFSVTTNVQVVKSGANTTYDELKRDNRVQVTVVDGTAMRIDIVASPSLQGVIREISNSTPAFITIREDSGYVGAYRVASDPEIVQGGSILRLTNLREGDRVNLELNNSNQVIYIELIDDGYTNVSKLTGDIWEIITDGSYYITIRNDDRSYLEYAVDRDVEVRRNGVLMNYNRLSIGDRVKLELGSGNRVNYIEVVSDDSQMERGTLTDLTIGSTPQLFIERNNGSVSRYSISNSATIRRDNGDSLRLRDLVAGSVVEVWLEYGEITKLNVIDDENIIIDGTVSYIYTNNNRLTIRQDSGNEFTYTLTDSAVIRDDSGRTIAFRDVREGWKVTLNLSNGRVTRLTCK